MEWEHHYNIPFPTYKICISHCYSYLLHLISGWFTTVHNAVKSHCQGPGSVFSIHLFMSTLMTSTWKLYITLQYSSNIIPLKHILSLIHSEQLVIMSVLVRFVSLFKYVDCNLMGVDAPINSIMHLASCWHLCGATILSSTGYGKPRPN